MKTLAVVSLGIVLALTGCNKKPAATSPEAPPLDPGITGTSEPPRDPVVAPRDPVVAPRDPVVTPPRPGPVVTPPPPAGAKTYTVVKGDTLTSIAKRFNKKVTDISAANKLTDPSKLSIGQVLVIP